MKQTILVTGASSGLTFQVLDIINILNCQEDISKTFPNAIRTKLK